MKLLIKRVTFQFNICTLLANSVLQPSLHLLIFYSILMIRAFSPWKPPQIACTECKIEYLIVIDIFVCSKGNHIRSCSFRIKIDRNLFALYIVKGCAQYWFSFLPFRFFVTDSILVNWWMVINRSATIWSFSSSVTYVLPNERTYHSNRIFITPVESI